MLAGLDDYMERHRVERLADLIGAFDPTPPKRGARVNRILVALDVDSRASALALADTLRGVGGRLQDRQAALHRRGPGRRAAP